jgi:hypothetical protein
MATFSLTECCSLLGIDPKTMRRWLIQADISAQNDPQDARIRCVTDEQLQYLAVLHHRLLHKRKEVPAPQQDLPALFQQEMDLMKERCACLEAQFLSLHTQLDQMVQEEQTSKKAREIQEHNDHQIAHATSSCIEEAPLHEPIAQEEIKNSSKQKQVIPLVEYRKEGIYTIISPEAGQLPFLPDSLEWFAWLETVPSFRFVGQFGHFTATCVSLYAPIPSRSRWRASRHIQNQSRYHRLGQTTSLTIDILEQAAAAFQSYMN